MKKSLIALLVATLPATAFAEVTVYGKIKGGLEFDKTHSIKKINIEDMGSHIGFKGQEDLGNGLKATWQIESSFGIDPKSTAVGLRAGAFANRNTFAGLETNMGTLRLGNLSNFLDSDMGLVDRWQYSDNALGLAIFNKNSGRVQKSIRYDIPNMSGLRAAVQYSPEEETSPTTTSRATTIAGVGYEQNNIFAKYAHMYESRGIYSENTDFDALIRSQKSDAGPKDPTGLGNNTHRVEVGYNGSNLLLAVGYQQQKGGLDIIDRTWANMAAQSVDVTQLGNLESTSIAKTREAAVTTGYKIGLLTPKLTYVYGDKIEIDGVRIEGTSYNQYVVGFDYELSPRTTFGAQLGQVEVRGAVKSTAHKALGINLSHAY